MDEGDAETVSADFPVHGIVDGFEVREECNGAFEVGEFADGDGVESCVLECTTNATVRLEDLERRRTRYVRSQSVAS